MLNLGYYAGSWYKGDCYLKIKYASICEKLDEISILKYKTKKLAEKAIKQLLKNPAANVSDQPQDWKIYVVEDHIRKELDE